MSGSEEIPKDASAGAPSYRALQEAAGALGLAVRGAFHPLADDGVPAPAGQAAAGTLVLLGNVGGSMWAHFSASAVVRSGARDPLDAWSREVVGALAHRFGAGALFPFGGPPWWPFQRWARRAEPVWPSPLGALVHPRFGTWHAYRGALVFGRRLEVPAPEPGASPCVRCVERPCLRRCPVGAFGETGFQAARCGAHLASEAGRACREEGCLARRACPVGTGYTYSAAQQRFHMRSFMRAHPPGAEAN